MNNHTVSFVTWQGPNCCGGNGNGNNNGGQDPNNPSTPNVDSTFWDKFFNSHNLLLHKLLCKMGNHYVENNYYCDDYDYPCGCHCGNGGNNNSGSTGNSNNTANTATCNCDPKDFISQDPLNGLKIGSDNKMFVEKVTATSNGAAIKPADLISPTNSGLTTDADGKLKVDTANLVKAADLVSTQPNNSLKVDPTGKLFYSDPIETNTIITNIPNGFEYTSENGTKTKITFEKDGNNVVLKVNGTAVSSVATTSTPVTVEGATATDTDLADDRLVFKKGNDTTTVDFSKYKIQVNPQTDGSIQILQNNVLVGTIPAQVVNNATTGVKTVTADKDFTNVSESNGNVNIAFERPFVTISGTTTQEVTASQEVTWNSYIRFRPDNLSFRDNITGYTYLDESKQTIQDVPTTQSGESLRTARPWLKALGMSNKTYMFHGNVVIRDYTLEQMKTDGVFVDSSVLTLAPYQKGTDVMIPIVGPNVLSVGQSSTPLFYARLVANTNKVLKVAVVGVLEFAPKYHA